MAKTEVRVEKASDVIAKIAITPKKMNDAIFEELVIAGQDLRNKMITSMRDTPKTGTKYKRQKGKKEHIASSPGNPPAVDTGELLRSIFSNPSKVKGTVEVGALVGAPYAPFLEGGTTEEGLEEVGGVDVEVFLIAPRPFLQPAVKELRPSIEKNLRNAIIRSTRGIK